MSETEKAFKPIYFLCYFIPIVLIMTGIPLALKLIEPNGIYGFRTSDTLSDPNVWYSVNTAGGISFVVTGLISILILIGIQKYWIANQILKFCVGFTIPLVLLFIGIAIAFTFG